MGKTVISAQRTAGKWKSVSIGVHPWFFQLGYKGQNLPASKKMTMAAPTAIARA